MNCNLILFRWGILQLLQSVFLLAPLQAAVPTRINHQGFVRVGGVGFDGTGHFRFAILDPVSGLNGWTHDGSALFVQDATPTTSLSIPVTKGLYSVHLGDPSEGMIPIPEFLFTEPNRVLRVWFDDGTNGLRRLVPDHPLTSSPYSFNALRAEMAGVAEFATTSETANRATVADMADRAALADFAENASRAMEADHAATAGDADTLDGLDSTEFLSQVTGNVQMFNEEFEVAPGESVETGQVVSFVDGSAQIRKGYAPAGAGPKIVFADTSFGIAKPSVARLSDNKIVVAYSDANAGGEASVIIGDIAGDTVAFGSPEVFSSASTFFSMAALAGNKIVVAYRDENNSNWGIVKVGDVSGNGVTFGNGVVYKMTSILSFKVLVLSKERFVIAYRDAANSDIPTARLGSVSGTTISLGGEVPFSSSEANSFDVASLSSTKFVFVFGKQMSGSHGRAAVGEIVSNSLVAGPEKKFHDQFTRGMSCVGLTDRRFVIAYLVFDDPVLGSIHAARVCEASGQELAFGQECVYRYSGSNDPSLAVALSPNRIAIANIRLILEPMLAGDWTLGEISGNRINFVAEDFFHRRGGTYFHAVSSLTANRFVVIYADAFNSFFGTLNIVRPEAAPILGVAREAGSAGESVRVTLFTRGALSDSHEGLLPGRTYYGQPDGSVSPDDSGVRLGTGVSATAILIDR